MHPIFPHCESVIQQLNHFVLPWTFSNSFSSLFRGGGQKCKPSLEEGFLTGTFISLSLSSALIIFTLDMLQAHSICCPLWSLWVFILFLFFFSAHWPSCICRFSLFWLQSNILYLKPIKQYPLILWFVEFSLLDKLDCGILATLRKSS